MKLMSLLEEQFQIYLLKAKELWQRENSRQKIFVADRILAKHDENYMPPELKNLMEENVK